MLYGLKKKNPGGGGVCGGGVYVLGSVERVFLVYRGWFFNFSHLY